MQRVLLFQLARFVAVGAANTVVDFAVFNLLALSLGLGEGDVRFATFKAISFAVAVLNSYVWNKVWVFRTGRLGGGETGREAGAFFAVSAASLLVNVAVSSALLPASRALLGAGPEWLAPNVAVLAGTVAAVAWTYVGYRFLVVRKFTNAA
jgi:putative flippase GtrA